MSFQRRRATEGAVARYGNHVLAEVLEGVVVVSFPKSGRTWLRVMLDRLGVRLAYTHDHSGHQKRLHLHQLQVDKSEFSDQKVILLIRDPRDVVVSGYLMASRRRKLFHGTLSEFLRDERHGLEKILHFNRTWYENRHQLADFLIVRYERLHEDTRAVLERILAFTDQQSVEAGAIDEAIEFCRFDNMQQLERQGHFEAEYGVLLSAHDDDPEALKTRRGRVGGYVNYLSAEDRGFCDGLFAGTGYPLIRRLPDEA